MKTIGLWTACLLLCAACDNRSLSTADGGAGPRDDVMAWPTPAPDGATSGVTTPDGAAADSGAPSAATLQAVVNRLIAPITSSQLKTYSLDLDGDGKKDNQFFRAFQSTLLIVPPPQPSFLQTFFDQQLQGGTRLTLLELSGSSLANDPAARITAYRGQDQDGNPKDNFSGSEPLAPAHTGTQLAASISNGILTAGPGAWRYYLPMGHSLPTAVALKMARVTSAVSQNGFSSTVIGGAISLTQMEQELVPGVAKVFDQIYKDPNTDPKLVNIFKVLDTNSDGTISAAEVLPLAKMLLIPDMDTDGDKTKDAVSIGFGVQTVPCKIAH